MTLEETDRLLICAFCRVKLHLVSRGPARLCLLPAHKNSATVYVPYWRFKGAFYACTTSELTHRIVDTSQQAIASCHVPFSLGLRPQALHLQFAGDKLEGTFLKPQVPFPKALSLMESRLPGIGASADGDGPPSFLEKAYIGETVSIIFAPYFVRGGVLFDGILDIPVSRASVDANWLSGFTSQRPGGSPGFLPALCPHCGWDLEGETDSCVFVCRHCDSAWGPKGAEMKRVVAGCIRSDSREAVHLPFWRIQPRVEGIALRSYADLVRLANLPRTVQKKWEGRPFVFWIPAFKVRPKLFLQLSRQVSCAPPEGKVEPSMRLSSPHPATLPLSEAVQALKLCLASMASARRIFYGMLPKIDVSVRKGHLVYVPFLSQGSDLVCEDRGFSLGKSSLVHGRGL